MYLPSEKGRTVIIAVINSMERQINVGLWLTSLNCLQLINQDIAYILYTKGNMIVRVLKFIRCIKR
jgi:hypothetical protein